MTLSSKIFEDDSCPWKFPAPTRYPQDNNNNNSNIVEPTPPKSEGPITDYVIDLLSSEDQCYTDLHGESAMGNANTAPNGKVTSCGPTLGCNPLSSDKKQLNHQTNNSKAPFSPVISPDDIKLDSTKGSSYNNEDKTQIIEKSVAQHLSSIRLTTDVNNSRPTSRTGTPVLPRKPGQSSNAAPIDVSSGRSSSNGSLKDAQAKDIMISYSHLDKEIMIKLKDALEAHNISVWVDVVGLNAGVNFLNKIGQAIIDSKMFITLLTERTVASKFCQDELALAYISNKPIFPVSIQPQTDIFPRIPTGMKLQLARFEWTQISVDNFEADFQVLLKKLKACLADIEGNSEARDEVSPLTAAPISPEGKLTRKPVLKKRSTRQKIYSRPNRSLSRCNSIIEQTEDIDSNAEFWDRNFHSDKSVPWESFESAFMKDYEKQLNMTYASSDREWFIDILKKELEVEESIIYQEKYKEFIMDEVDGKMKEQPILKCVNDLAVENYTMREVFNMDSSVRIDAINNLAKFGSPAVVEALLDLLDDQEHDVRASACISLAKSKAGCMEMKIDRLMRCLKDSDRFVRESACVALGYLKAPGAVPALLQIWRNDYISSVRDAAELALQQIGGDEVNRAMKMTQILTAEIGELIKVLTGKNTSPKNGGQKKWGGPGNYKAYTLPHSNQNYRYGDQ